MLRHPDRAAVWCRYESVREPPPGGRYVMAGALALGLAGCTSGPQPRATSLVVSTEFESIVADPGRLRGELGVSEGGCLFIEIDAEETVVWAAYGSSLSQGGTVFELADVGGFSLGEEVDVPGVIAKA